MPNFHVAADLSET